MTLTPAYGRDYKSKKAVLEDWNAGKDFIIQDMSSPWDGRPANIESFKPGETVNIRYNGLRKIAVVKGGKIKPPAPKLNSLEASRAMLAEGIKRDAAMDALVKSLKR